MGHEMVFARSFTISPLSFGGERIGSLDQKKFDTYLTTRQQEEHEALRVTYQQREETKANLLATPQDYQQVYSDLYQTLGINTVVPPLEASPDQIEKAHQLGFFVFVPDVVTAPFNPHVLHSENPYTHDHPLLSSGLIKQPDFLAAKLLLDSHTTSDAGNWFLMPDPLLLVNHQIKETNTQTAIKKLYDESRLPTTVAEHVIAATAHQKFFGTPLGEIVPPKLARRIVPRMLVLGSVSGDNEGNALTLLQNPDKKSFNVTTFQGLGEPNSNALLGISSAIPLAWLQAA